MLQTLPNLGVGLGYRTAQHQDIIRYRNEIDFLEIISDQFIFSPQEKLERLFLAAEGLPLVPHSLAMSVGTAAAIDEGYLRKNAEFINLVNAPWFSDHLCFTKVPEIDLGSLTPLWFTQEVVEHVVTNIRTIQRAVPNRPFLVENITYYFPLPENEMTETEFITEILERADCGLLLDINNVYINSQNLHFDPYQFLESIPQDRIVQIHIAGHQVEPDMILDTHDSPVSHEVWNLLEYVVKRSPVKGVLLERDDKFPDFPMIVEELQHARQILCLKKQHDEERVIAKE